jgi:glycosyltransferase involved in cell wall biosynthesis
MSLHPTTPPSDAVRVSACLVVRDEEAVIGRCLRSLSGVADEIVLVHDGPCHDATVTIAEELGCRVFVAEATGDPEHHTVFAYGQARGEWILTLDADEFLSAELARVIPELIDQPDYAGWEFRWPMWDGTRYITEHGPYKLALFRRRSVHLLGMIHGVERVDPPVRRVELQLEHRPRYNNLALSTVLTKWRRWARINAREFLMPYAEIPRFNWDGPADWPRRRRIVNRLAPLLFVPIVPVVFVLNLLRERGVYTLRENLRMSLGQGIYAGMVQFYVAKYQLLAGEDSVAEDPPRPRGRADSPRSPTGGSTEAR